MKIVFTGGGPGGHFYPLVAVAQAINREVTEKKLVAPRLFYLASRAYDERALFETNLKFRRVPAGKRRRYFSPLNFLDTIRTGWGIIVALAQLFLIYPDLIFSKGGYDSFPTLLAARWLKIPVFIHESDAKPGRVNLWSAKFAVRIALSYAEAASYFPAAAGARIAVTGNPIREELLLPISVGAREVLKLEPAAPIFLVIGGSQGAAAINDTLVDILPALLERYQVVHQTGAANLAEVKQRVSVLLHGHPHAGRYRPFANLNSDALRMAGGGSSLAVTRAGSILFEMAAWGLPAIVVPIPEPISHHQHENALTYARQGGAVVLEQNNLTPSILLSEINRLFNQPNLLAAMATQAKKFARPEAARLIAAEIIKLALAHES